MSIPKVAVTRVSRLSDTRLVVVDCPYCGREHTQGWPYGDDSDPGDRAAHCFTPEARAVNWPGYYLTTTEEQR